MILITAAAAIAALAPRAMSPDPRLPRPRMSPTPASPQQHRRPTLQRRVAWSLRLVGALSIAGVAGPPVAALVVLAAWHLRRRVRAARSRKAARRRRRELIEVAELLAIGLQNGHHPASVCRSIPTRLDGEIADALERAVRRHDRGSPFVEALEQTLTPLGTEAASLAALIGSGATEGASLLASLADHADDLRGAVHREVETAARQLPVHMLGPLVACVLPAFLALTVVPVVLDSVVTLVG